MVREIGVGLLTNVSRLCKTDSAAYRTGQAIHPFDPTHCAVDTVVNASQKGNCQVR
jgi:hypothetical protein